ENNETYRFLGKITEFETHPKNPPIKVFINGRPVPPSEVTEIQPAKVGWEKDPRDGPLGKRKIFADQKEISGFKYLPEGEKIRIVEERHPFFCT
ncbi:MAG: hypothetical protein ABEJ72_08375, partial [Candidatus Aenigmatarchaeota archaeon]